MRPSMPTGAGSGDKQRASQEVIDKAELTSPQYVAHCIQAAKAHFTKESGTRKASLGDVISTRIESPYILSHHLFDPTLSDSQRRKTLIKGNVKAIIPIMREKYAFVGEKYKKVS